MQILREKMAEQGVTQASLAAMTGIPQPRISNYLTGKVRPSVGKVDLMFSSLGLVIDFEPRVEQVEMRHSERRSWMLHRQLASHLSEDVFAEWKPTLLANVTWMRDVNKGEPHLSNIARWEAMIHADDVEGLRHMMLDLSRDGQEMREVAPFVGLLPQEERAQVLADLSRA